MLADYLKLLLFTESQIAVRLQTFYSQDLNTKILHDMLEKVAKVSLGNSKGEGIGYYQFPDGVFIPIGDERCKCTELFFQPHQYMPLKSSVGGLPTLIPKAIKDCDQSMQAQLYHNIVITGGNSKYSGFDQRLELELNRTSKRQFSNNILSYHDIIAENNYFTKLPPEIVEHVMNFYTYSKMALHPFTGKDKLLAAWKGAQKMASEESFFEQCVLLEDYEEEGPFLVSRSFI
eukprot:TRINITY_DN4102_c0_g2_i2.p1 TRINITY_DN4102_c0_g2~~TRINITY_DN4102_c0_g2_i2.p1  ORF type:complete len:232 (-),score=28.97 TRINITY_DN4102_c0_g2_i2:74-769(-)